MIVLLRSPARGRACSLCPWGAAGEGMTPPVGALRVPSLCAGLPSWDRWGNGPLPEPPVGLSFDGLAVWLRRGMCRARPHRLGNRGAHAGQPVVCRSSQVNTLGFCVVVTQASAEFEL